MSMKGGVNVRLLMGWVGFISSSRMVGEMEEILVYHIHYYVFISIKLILYTIDCCGPVMWKNIIKIRFVTSDEVIIVSLCLYSRTPPYGHDYITVRTCIMAS